MPLIDQRNPDHFSWRENVKKKTMDIPLYPLGEVNVYDFYMGTLDFYVQHERIIGFQAEALLVVFISVTFSYNLCMSINMIRKRSSSLLS
jgi:hypothetical protein